MKITKPFITTGRLQTGGTDEVCVAVNRDGDALVFPAESAQVPPKRGIKVIPEESTKGVASDGSLTVVEFAKRVGMPYGGYKTAKGLIIARDTIAGLSTADLAKALQGSSTVGLSQDWAEWIAAGIKNPSVTRISRYAAFFAALTAFSVGVQKAIWPKMSWKKAFLIAMAIAVVSTILLWIGVYCGVFQADAVNK